MPSGGGGGSCSRGIPVRGRRIVFEWQIEVSGSGVEIYPNAPLPPLFGPVPHPQGAQGGPSLYQNYNLILRSIHHEYDFR